MSERSKDLKDVATMISTLKTRFDKEEMEELKNINKKNIEIRTVSNIRVLFKEFERCGMEISVENIIKYFSSQIEEPIEKMKDEDYAKKCKKLLKRIKNFSSLSNEPKMIKEEFMNFMIDNSRPIAEYYNKIINGILDSSVNN